MSGMMNGGDPNAHQPGYPPGGAMPALSGQYPLPPTPNSNMTNPSVPGNPSPQLNSDLPPGFPPTPIQSIDTKDPGIKMMSPTGLSGNDPSAQISIPSLPSSVKSEVKSELLSPTFPPGSITAPPFSQQQQIKTELNTNVGSIPPLPSDTNIPSVKTPAATGKAPLYIRVQYLYSPYFTVLYICTCTVQGLCVVYLYCFIRTVQIKIFLVGP